MSGEPDNRSTIRKAWDAVAGTISGWWNSARETVTQTYNRASEQVTQTYNNATQAISNAEQIAADTYDDVRHPLYTGLKKGLCAVFGKAAVKWGVDQVMSIFGKDNKDVHAFGSGTFMAEMQKWQRQFERDPDLKTPAAVPAPA